MKILMFTPYLPYPLVSGGQIRTYNLLKNLSKKHEITLASFIREKNEKRYVQELSKYCQNVIVFQRRKAWSPLNVVLAGITPYPFLVSIYFDLTVKKRIRQELSKNNYDLIHAETFYVMPNIPKTSVPILLVEQVIEYLVYQRYVEGLPYWSLPLKALLFADVAKIKWWERHYWEQARRLATMSEEDRQFIKKFDPKLKVDVVSNGVDIEYFDRTKKVNQKYPTVLFVGNFKWLPNRDAATFLISSIWPKIKEKIKGAQLWIVGRNPPTEITKFTAPDVRVDGAVDDIRSAYGASNVLLAPIRNGRGTKYKILEAMATKTPIVATKLATEGIKIENGLHALIEEDSQSLANKTIRILKNPKLGKNLADAAYELVEKDYNWKKISEDLDRVYHQVAKI